MNVHSKFGTCNDKHCREWWASGQWCLIIDYAFYQLASKFTKAVCTLFSVAMSWKLNVASYLCGVHKPCLLIWEEIVPSRAVVNSWFRFCTSLVLRPMSVVFGLGMRLHVHMCTKLENGILHNGQQPQCVVNGFLMTRVNLKLWRHWMVVEPRTLISISFVLKWHWVLKSFEILLLNIVVLRRRNTKKKALLLPHT